MPVTTLLGSQILEELQTRPSQRAAEIGKMLGANRTAVSKSLWGELTNQVVQDASYRWSIKAGRRDLADAYESEGVSATELADLLGAESDQTLSAYTTREPDPGQPIEAIDEAKSNLQRHPPGQAPSKTPQGTPLDAFPTPPGGALEFHQEIDETAKGPTVRDLATEQAADWADREVPDLDFERSDSIWYAAEEVADFGEQEFNFEIPEIGYADRPETKTDLTPEVGTEHRARQLATQFLKEHGELSRINAECVVEIILQRRWSSAQLKVQELLLAGCSIPGIFLAFKLSTAWRDCPELDERFGENIHLRQWARDSAPSLTWAEAMNLVRHFGEDADELSILEFAECERQVWRIHTEIRRSFPTFKDYLVCYRLSDGVRSPASGWTATLDPHDGRTFDGSRNPEFSSSWWEDELLPHASAGALAERIFKGAELDSLFPDRKDDLAWFDFDFYFDLREQHR